MDGELLAWLQRERLEALIPVFAELGVVAFADLVDVAEEDLVCEGITTIQRRRFLRLRSQPAASPPGLPQPPVPAPLPPPQVASSQAAVVSIAGSPPGRPATAPPARSPRKRRRSRFHQGVRDLELARHRDEIKFRVRMILDDMHPDSLEATVDGLGSILLRSAEELDLVASIIFGRALAEPRHCNTYADVVDALRTRYPEFPPESEGMKAHSFTRSLLSTCQAEFESWPTSFEPTEVERRSIPLDELLIEVSRRKVKALAVMKFIGSLFSRRLLAYKVIGQVVYDLIGINTEQPEEHTIECVCELLRSIGRTVDGTDDGRLLMSQFLAGLDALMSRTGPEGSKVFSSRMQCQIQDLRNLRGNSWIDSNSTGTDAGFATAA